ncbi:unnamed protein product, partial [Mesorhabditis spiculigera]
MGCIFSSEEYSTQLVKNEAKSIPTCKFNETPLLHKESVVLGKNITNAHLAVAMLQANKAAAFISLGSPFNDQLEYDMAQKIIRKAKNEGCTVSIVNSCLYIDYKFVGALPPGMF